MRLAVLGAVISSHKPLGAPDVIRKLGDDTDSVTVYRTLNTLAEHKLVHRVRGEDGAWRYASSSAGKKEDTPHSHAHFVCDECGTVECLEESSIPKSFVPSLRIGSRYAVRYPEVVLHGLCPKCHE
jgi:Fur family ferric uptake transcriptional regulator